MWTKRKSDEPVEASRKYAFTEILESFIYQIEVIKIFILTIFIEEQFLMIKQAQFFTLFYRKVTLEEIQSALT